MSTLPADAGTRSRLATILCLDDFESAAQRHLPRPIFGYVAGAAESNRSYRDNREAFDDHAFVPRVLAHTWLYAHRLGLPTPSLDELAAGDWPRYAWDSTAAATLH